MKTTKLNKQQFWILRDSSGQKSTSFTMMWSSFLILSIWLLLNIFEFPYVREFSSETALAWISPLILLYFGRQSQKAPTTSSDSSESETSPTTSNLESKS